MFVLWPQNVHSRLELVFSFDLVSLVEVVAQLSKFNETGCIRGNELDLFRCSWILAESRNESANIDVCNKFSLLSISMPIIGAGRYGCTDDSDRGVGEEMTRFSNSISSKYELSSKGFAIDVNVLLWLIPPFGCAELTVDDDLRTGRCGSAGGTNDGTMLDLMPEFNEFDRSKVVERGGSGGGAQSISSVSVEFGCPLIG